MNRDDLPYVKDALTKAIIESDKSEIYQILQKFTGSDKITLLIHNAKNSSLYGVYADYAIDTRELDYDSLLGEVFHNHKAKLCGHIMSEKNYNPIIDNPYDTKLRSQVILPIVDNNALIGIVRLSKTIANNKIYTTNTLGTLKLLLPIFTQLIYSFQPHQYSKLNTAIEQTRQSEECKVTQSSIMDDITSIDSMLDYIYQNVSNENIKQLIEQNKVNMKRIHDEYISNVIQKTVIQKEAEEITLAPEEKQQVNILIADDVKLNASILEAILKDPNHSICVANDGDIALEKMEKIHAMGESIDILFLDHHMPNMLGAEVVDNLLKDKEKYTNGKIYIVSITNDPSAIEERKELYDFHIRKPFMKTQISEIVQDIKENYLK